MSSAMAIPARGEYNKGKITPILVISCTIAAIGGALFGYDVGISEPLYNFPGDRDAAFSPCGTSTRLTGFWNNFRSGVTSMEPFLMKFFPEVYTRMKEEKNLSNYCKFDSQLVTLFSSSLYVAGLVASFFASSITTSFGRKPSILIGGASIVVGSSIAGAALNVFMLLFGRLFLGIGVAFVNQSVPLYLSEMAPSTHRGAISNGFHFSYAIGAMSAHLMNYVTQKIKSGWGWRISLAAAAIPALSLFLGSLFLPETPNSLIQLSNNSLLAKKTLQRVRGTKDVDAEFDDLVEASKKSKSIKHPFKKILEQRYRPELIMVIAIPFFQQVTGINVIGIYGPLLFRTMGLGESAALLSTVVLGGLGIVFNFLSMLIVDRVGRRVLLIVGGIQMLISQIVIGSIMAVHLGDQGSLPKEYALVVLIFICVYTAGFNVSWGPLSFLIPSEILPLEIRSAGQSINVAVNFLFIFIIAQSLLSMLCHLKYGIFFFFGGWIVAMTVFVYYLLPETKNVPIEQMDRVWREHWFWNRFVVQKFEESSKENDTTPLL